MADEDNKQAEKQEEKKEEAQAEAPKEEKSDGKAEPNAKSDSGGDEPKAEVPAKFKKLVEEIEKLSVLELSELVKSLEDRFGVSAAAPVAAVAAPSAGDGAGDAEDDKSEFDLVLKDAGAKKIDVIKAVREISGLGLAESKGLVDGAPKTVKEKLKKEEAEEAKKKLEDAGATVELK